MSGKDNIYVAIVDDDDSASALSISGAILLILEMDRPLSGWIRVSRVPMQQAIGTSR